MSDVKKRVDKQTVEKLKGILATLPVPVLQDLLSYIRGLLNVGERTYDNTKKTTRKKSSD